MLGPTEQSNTLKKLVMMRLKREPGITDTEIDDDPSSIADLFDQYHSHPETGLDGDQKTFGSTVRNNIKKYGSNVLVPPKTESEFAKIIKKQVYLSITKVALSRRTHALFVSVPGLFMSLVNVFSVSSLARHGSTTHCLRACSRCKIPCVCPISGCRISNLRCGAVPQVECCDLGPVSHTSPFPRSRRLP